MDLKRIRKNIDSCHVSGIKYVRRIRDLAQWVHCRTHSVHGFIHEDYGLPDMVFRKHMNAPKTGEAILIPGGASYTFPGNHQIPYRYLKGVFYGTVPEKLSGSPVTTPEGSEALTPRIHKVFGDAVERMPMAEPVKAAK